MWRENRNNNINNKRNIDMLNKRQNENNVKKRKKTFAEKLMNLNQNRIGLLRVCSTT